MTINSGMVLQKAVRARMSSLVGIRNASVVKTTSWDYLGDGKPKERVETELQYNPKAVDKKITELEMFLFKLEAAIKTANAKTEIEIVADVDSLLAPIA